MTQTEMELELRRLMLAREAINVMGRYTALHSASRQQETLDLFALDTPGCCAYFNGAKYKEKKGIENHFLGLMATTEADLTARLYLHDIVSPIIEVAGDAQSVKCLFSTHGCESNPPKDPNAPRFTSSWCFGKYYVDMIVVDGVLKIYRMDLHTTFLTDYAGKGWTYEPFTNPWEYSTFDPREGEFAPDEVDYDWCRPLSDKTASCDVHDLIPAPPAPYETYDFDAPWPSYMYNG